MAMRIMLRDVEEAVRMYYQFPEIGTPEIMRLYQCSRFSALKLKKLAQAKQQEMGKSTFSPLNVNTRCAFLAWNLDIGEMEKAAQRLQKYKKKEATA